MKKIYLIIALLLPIQAVFGQSARLVLVEEFTGETCGPCAASNPGLNILLDSKAGNVISLKYQNNIPSAGPNFYAYNIPDITNRTSFYANTYSPHAFIDGNYWNGNAASVTATLLNNRIAVTSPFDIIVSHDFSPANDIIYTHIVIRATQAVNNINLKSRVAISEQDVYGYTSPNGEDYYQHVMRKLLPTGTGTALPSTWAIGDSVVTDLQWTIAVPTGTIIKKPLWPMLEVIAWVQDDVTKQILQTGHSPAQITLDPALESLSNISSINCTGSVTPDLTVKSLEIAPVTSLDIEYSLDNQAPTSFNWTGNITQGNSAIISLPASIPIVPGAHSVSINIVNVNGAPDLIPTNNRKTAVVGQPLTPAVSFTQDFLSTTFPPADWLIENNDFSYTWTRSTANSGSAKIDFYNSAANQIDIFYALTPADLSTAVNPRLTFSVAHKQYSAAYSDKIEVIASVDCGQNWSSIWSKAGAALASTPGYATSAFTPSVAQWRSDTASLSSFIGQPNVLLAFKATSAYGNNAYIDNINLNAVVGISENEAANNSLVSLYPVPSNGNLTLNVNKIVAKNLELTITGITGIQARAFVIEKSDDVINLDLTDLENGTYFLNINAGEQRMVKRFVINK